MACLFALLVFIRLYFDLLFLYVLALAQQLLLCLLDLASISFALVVFIITFSASSSGASTTLL